MSISLVLAHGSRIACVVLLALVSGTALAGSASDQASAALAVPDTLAVRHALPPPPKGVSELKFRDLFRSPVGPRGLELSDRALKLAGKRVRVVGFMVAEPSAATDVFMLAPMPAEIGEDDEQLADDLPPGIIFVHLANAPAIKVPHLSGLLQFTGTLSVGAEAEAIPGRVSAVRLQLDRRTTRVLLQAGHKGGAVAAR